MANTCNHEGARLAEAKDVDEIYPSVTGKLRMFMCPICRRVYVVPKLAEAARDTDRSTVPSSPE